MTMRSTYRAEGAPVVQKPEPDICAVNLGRREAYLTDGAVARIDTFLDEDGDAIEDGAEAQGIVIEMPNGEWGYLDLDAFDFDRKPN